MNDQNGIEFNVHVEYAMEPLLAQEFVMLMQKKICLNPLEMR